MNCLYQVRNNFLKTSKSLRQNVGKLDQEGSTVTRGNRKPQAQNEELSQTGCPSAKVQMPKGKSRKRSSPGRNIDGNDQNQSTQSRRETGKQDKVKSNQD